MTYGEMVERIRGLSPEGAAVFAAGCAYRVSPIVGACATSQTAAHFRNLLELIFRGADSQATDGLVESLRSAPELEAESAEELHYWAKHSLALLFEAVAARNPDESIERCEACCALALNIAGDFDAVSSGDEGGPEVELPPVGFHERLEMVAQSQAIELLTVTGEQSEQLVKALSQASVTRYDEAMPEFVRAVTEM